jgi:hypothetical protein
MASHACLSSNIGRCKSYHDQQPLTRWPSNVRTSPQELSRVRWEVVDNPGDDSVYVATIRKVGFVVWCGVVWCGVVWCSPFWVHLTCRLDQAPSSVLLPVCPPPLPSNNLCSSPHIDQQLGTFVTSFPTVHHTCVNSPLVCMSASLCCPRCCLTRVLVWSHPWTPPPFPSCVTRWCEPSCRDSRKQWGDARSECVLARARAGAQPLWCWWLMGTGCCSQYV